MLYGVSLHTPRLVEVRKAQRLSPWDPRTAPVLKPHPANVGDESGRPAEVYLHHLPCASGFAFFPEFWMEFKVSAHLLLTLSLVSNPIFPVTYTI